MSRYFILFLTFIFCSEELYTQIEPEARDKLGWFAQKEGANGSVLPEDTTLPKTMENMKILFPTSFTPNGDGLNDEFRGEAQNILSVEISIQNLRGDEVFHAYDISASWDGEFLGNHAAAGPYIWKARATGYLNNKKVVHNYHGVVELIR